MKRYTGPAKPIPLRVRPPVSRYIPCVIYTFGIIVLLLDVYYWRAG
jgi:hypothetical protein